MKEAVLSYIASLSGRSEKMHKLIVYGRLSGSVSAAEVA